MGYREEIALTYTKNAWACLMEVINELSDNKRQMVIDLLKSAEVHTIKHGDHLIVWSSIKRACADWKELHNCNLLIDNDSYFAFVIGEDGAEDSWGGFYENPFEICTSHVLDFDAGTNDFSWDEPSIKKSVAKTPMIVDDHTCIHCGNSKYSKSEKSCWKCGHPI